MNDADTRALVKSTLKNRLIQGFIDLIGVIISFAAFGLVYNYLDPKVRYYTCDQSDVSYPYLSETVPLYAVGIYGVIGPVVVFTFVELYNAKVYPFQTTGLRPKTRFRQFAIIMFHTISLFSYGIGITLLLTEIGKRWSGRLRPHFIAVCAPTSLTAATCQVSGVYQSFYTGGSFCTGDSSKVKEARLSFPSGHASVSAFTMLFTIIYLQYRLITLRFRTVRPLLQVAAASAAWTVSLSRIIDYWHRGSDVIAGAVLGGFIAICFAHFIGKGYLRQNKEEVDFDEIEIT